MDEKLKKAVVRTLAYSDIFEYPLRVSELEQYLIGFPLDRPQQLSSVFTNMKQAQIAERNGFFFLKGRKKIIELRQEREKISETKMQRARKILKTLKRIPFIKMAAVTGAVAAGNADGNSDIDVLIVTQEKRMFLARLFTILLMELKGIRRRPNPTSSRKNKICLNMFITEESLKLPNKDLFTANEFARMKVVWEKDNVYGRFIKVNEWVKAFLPNWQPTVKSQISNLKSQSHNLNVKSKKSFKIYDLVLRFEFCVLSFLEVLARVIQLRYMSKRRTTEVVQNGLLMFHPHNAREWVMEEYRKRISY